MKVQKKFIVIGLVAALLAGGYFFFLMRAEKMPELYTIQRKDLKSTISASGNLSGKTSFDLKFRSSGKIYTLKVKAGDTVNQGQLLASVDNRDQIIALSEAQNTLREKQATVDKTIDDIHLFQYGMGGFGSVGSSNETMTQRQLRTGVEVARDNAFDNLKSAQKALEDTLIISPVNGIVTEVPSSINQYVSAADIIIKIADTSEVFFDGEIDEADIDKISLGQMVEVTLDAYPNKVFKGVVGEIQPFTKSSSSGAMIITVRIKLEKMEEKFIQGLSGEAAIILAEAKNSLVVPVEAVRENDTVLVRRNGQLTPQKITRGLSSESEIEIKEGLNENDQIVKSQ